MTMESTTEPLEILTVSDENVAVEEQLTRKNGGWVISFSLSSKGEQSVGVRISVPMPDESVKQDVGFHPKHKPQTWRIRNGVLTFEDKVPSDEPLVIMLGIVLVDDEDVSLSLSEPTIELSQPVESEDESDFLSEESPIFRSSSLASTDRGEDAIPNDPVSEPSPSVEDSGSEDVADDDEPAPEPIGDELGGGGDADGSTAPLEGGDPTSPSDEDALGSIGEAFNLENRSETSAAESVDPVDDSGADVEDSIPLETGDSFAGPPTPTDERAPADAASKPPTDARNAVDSSADLLSTLVARLESADPDDELLVALRRLLGPDHQKTMDVRLQHVQSRMDDLAAYTGALEGLINKHGTASDFMDEIEGALDQVSADVDGIRQAVDDAETDRRELHEQVDDVESAIEDFRSRTENIYEDLDSIRATVNAREEMIQDQRESIADHDGELKSLVDRVASTESEVEDHRDALDQRLSTLSNQVLDLRETVDTDLARVQDEVESLSEMRGVFARAFAGAGIEEEVGDVDVDEEAAE